MICRKKKPCQHLFRRLCREKNVTLYKTWMGKVNALKNNHWGRGINQPLNHQLLQRAAATSGGVWSQWMLKKNNLLVKIPPRVNLGKNPNKPRGRQQAICLCGNPLRDAHMVGQITNGGLIWSFLWRLYWKRPLSQRFAGILPLKRNWPIFQSYDSAHHWSLQKDYLSP